MNVIKTLSAARTRCPGQYCCVAAGSFWLVLSYKRTNHFWKRARCLLRLELVWLATFWLVRIVVCHPITSRHSIPEPDTLEDAIGHLYILSLYWFVYMETCQWIFWQTTWCANFIDFIFSATLSVQNSFVKTNCDRVFREQINVFKQYTKKCNVLRLHLQTACVKKGVGAVICVYIFTGYAYLLWAGQYFWMSIHKVLW